MTQHRSIVASDRQLAELHDLLEPESGVDMPDTNLPVQEFHSLFISDIHLGRFDCEADRTSVMLDRSRLKHKIFVIGDAIDFWLFRGSRPQHFGRIFREDTYISSGVKLLRYGIHVLFRAAKLNVFQPSHGETMRWPQSHNLVMQKFLRILRKIPGIFVPGNHDELISGFTNDLYAQGEQIAYTRAGATPYVPKELRKAYFQSPSLGNMDVVEQFVYESKAGDHLHVCHGHQFDPPLKKSSMLGMVATLAFHGLLTPAMRKLYLGDKAKRLTDYVNSGHTLRDIEAFYDRYAKFLDEQNALRAEFNKQNPYLKPLPPLRGGIHGHVHNPGIRKHRGYVFMDTGDWVDKAHCTALAEHCDGRWQLMTADREHGIRPSEFTLEPMHLDEVKEHPLPRRFENGNGKRSKAKMAATL